MLRFALVTAVAVVQLGRVGAEPPAPGPVVPASASGPLEAVQGYWKPLSIQFEGKPQMSADELKTITGVFDGAEYHLYYKKAGADPLKLARAAVALDPATKVITFEYAMGPLKGHKRHGIYEVVGGELRLCYGPADKARPAKFDAPDKSGYFLEVWGKQPQK